MGKPLRTSLLNVSRLASLKKQRLTSFYSKNDQNNES